jgi:hypothetical protein
LLKEKQPYKSKTMVVASGNLVLKKYLNNNLFIRHDTIMAKYVQQFLDQGRRKKGSRR